MKKSDRVAAQQQRDGQEEVYHERQSMQRCAMHAMNNLLQRRAFEPKDLDKLCSQLSPGSWINPHKSLWGTGNYDINVITLALQSLPGVADPVAVKWFDERKDVADINLDACLGLIVNVNSSKFFYKSRHWFTIRKVGKIWYNLDSKLKTPDEIPDILGCLRAMIHATKSEKRGFLYLISTESMAERVYRSPQIKAAAAKPLSKEDEEIKSLIEATEGMGV